MTVRCSLGHENPEGSAFCDECGERLAPAAGSSTPGAVATVPDASAPAATPAPVATAAPATETARLVVQADSQTFDLTGKNEVVIGREDPVSNIYPDIDLTPHGGEEGGVSRLHAKLYQTGGQYLVEDQNSTNFTFVNRQKLAPKTPTPIHNGDELRLGRVALKFETQP
ncbi:MAG TPA: FHA domain-containing protein [Ktedonobacterales bacterium]